MANRGLKGYTGQLTTELRNGTGYVNINKDDANLIFNIPLFSIASPKKLNLSLIYNYQTNSENGLFGKGFKLNLYTEIKLTPNVSVKNADGSVDMYEGVAPYAYKCKEIGNVLRIIKEQGITYHTITNKEGYFAKYNLSISKNYPVEMGLGDELIKVYLHDSTNKKIDIKNDEYVIYFQVDDLFVEHKRVEKISYKSFGLTQTYEFEYTDDDYISTIIYKVNDRETLRTVFEYGETYINFRDITNKHDIRYTINEKKVICIKNVNYPKTNSKISETRISYFNRKTELIDDFGNTLDYFFDENGKALYSVQKKHYFDGGQRFTANLINTQYNSDGLLIHQSSNIRYRPENGNLLNSKRVDNFTNNGLTLSDYSVYTYNYFYRPMLTDTADRVVGTGSLTKVVNVSGVKGDNFIVCLLIKLVDTNSSIPMELKLSYAGTSKSTVLRKLSPDDEFEFVTLGIHLESSIENITISIIVSDSNLIVGGAQLLKKDFGCNYIYDASNTLICLESKEGKTEYEYNTDKLVSHILYPNYTEASYEYKKINGNYKTTKSTMDKTAEEIEYDEQYAKDTFRIISASDTTEKIKTSSKLYGQAGRLADEYGERQYYFHYEYYDDKNGNGIETEVHSPQGEINSFITRTHRYNTNNLVNYIKKEHVNAGEEFTVKYGYDSSQNICKITNANSSVINFKYNENNDLDTVDLNNTVISKINYTNDDKYLVSNLKYGISSDSYNFVYDQSNYYRLSKITYTTPNNVVNNRFDFTYNEYNQLKEVWFYPTNNTNVNVLKEYSYDENERISKITSQYFNYTYEYIYDNCDNLRTKKLNINNNVKYISYDNDNKNMSTSLHTINQNILSMFDIIPLDGDVTSIKGLRPVKFEHTRKPFVYDDSFGRRAYQTDFTNLVYDMSFSESGTVCAILNTTVYLIDQYIFSISDGLNNIGVYFSDRNIYLDVNENHNVETNISVNTALNKVAFSFTKRVVGGSSFTTYIDIRIMCNNSIYERSFPVTSFGNVLVHIGERYDGRYGFIGHISNVAFRPAYCEVSTIKTLFNELIGKTLTYNIDSLGRVNEKRISSSSNKLRHQYTFVTYSAEYKTHLVKEELITYGNTTVKREYNYDSLDRVISITDPVFGNKEYTYDYRGFLIKEKRNTTRNNEINYTYDDNGNITSAGNTAFKYDDIKDRLKECGGRDVNYSNTSPGNISYSDAFSYDYEGKRLIMVSYANTDDYWDVSFTYDEEGLILKRHYKVYSEDDDDWEEDTFYYYENGNLVCEINDDVRNDYLYDNGGNLYGFIQNNNSIYYYIRDILGNILGIVNDSGVLVAKYDYDAYGNLLSSTGNIYNPFRYKGYYYDSRIDLYYLKSRFYSPWFRRFLTPDNINYLDVNNAGCINLYAYCNNNPVMYSDPDGRFWILSAIAIGALVGMASQFGMDSLSNFTRHGFDFSSWRLSSWQNYVGAAVGGAIGGALSVIAGPAASAFVDGVTSSITSMTLENLTGANEINYSSGEIFFTSMFIGAFSAVTVGLIDGITRSPNEMLDDFFRRKTETIVDQIKRLGKEMLNTMPYSSINSFTNGVVLTPRKIGEKYE